MYVLHNSKGAVFMKKQTERNYRFTRQYGRALCAALALVIAAALLPWGGMRAKADVENGVSIQKYTNDGYGSTHVISGSNLYVTKGISLNI